jgi:hypothetical protein
MEPREHQKVVHDFYAIALTVTVYPGGFTCRQAPERRTAYFKADRYSPYSGRLQLEHHPLEGRRFKTAEGAAKAITRLVAKGTITASHQPTVVRYTETVVCRWEPVTTTTPATTEN